MGTDNFASMGKMEAISRLYEGTPYKPFCPAGFETSGKAVIETVSRTFLEGIDFDLTYFPLKHLGYKAVISTVGEMYALMSHPRTLAVKMNISSKLDFSHVSEIWSGVIKAAQEHGFRTVSLDLEPSLSGLCISVSSTGETSLLTDKRRRKPKSMDLLCISGNLGAAYLGQMVLEREKEKFSVSREQPVLDEYRQFVGAYLKPDLSPGIVSDLENAEIYPCQGCFVTKGLADAVKRLARDSHSGAKIYAERLPFAGNSFELGKKFDIDPLSAAMNGGDDYRILFTIPLDKAEKFRCDFQTFDIIGHLALEEAGTVIVTPDGVEFPLKAQGWSGE